MRAIQSLRISRFVCLSSNEGISQRMHYLLIGSSVKKMLASKITLGKLQDLLATIPR
jgi:hypothetical protein